MDPTLLSISVTALLLLIGIVWACAVFTNAIEWLGVRLKLSEGAVGSLLAAVGTALPETIVPIVAILSGVLGWGNVSAEAGHEIGIGAILGAPFMLGTLAFFVSGFAVLIYALFKKRGLHMTLNEPLFLRDMKYFFPAFGAAISAAFLPPELGWARYAIAVGLLIWYGIYAFRTLALPHETEQHPEAATDSFDPEDVEPGHDEPLWFAPKHAEPPMSRIMLQTAVGLGGIVLLAHSFVDTIHAGSELLHIPAMVLSLIIVPIATELPEKFNSVIWLGKEKDTLALGNITGAMVFQSTIPTAIGVAFTPWFIESFTLTSVVLCLVSSALISTLVFLTRAHITPWIFLTGGVFYAYFVYQVFTTH